MVHGTPPADGLPRDVKRLVGRKLRRQIAWEAAQIVYGHQDVDLERARRKAARRVCKGRVRPQDYPRDAEIRAQLKQLTNGYGGAPLEAMEQSGDVCNQDPDLRALPWEVCRDHYESLLMPLEHVREPWHAHPEGDVLYHSLQVFVLAGEHAPYDEELLLAALLHDVGKAIDPRRATAAAVEALEGYVSPRTGWFVEHWQTGLKLLDATAGARTSRRFRAHDDYDNLLLLSRCDRRGRRVGVQVPDVSDALAQIEGIIAWCGDADAAVPWREEAAAPHED